MKAVHVCMKMFLGSIFIILKPKRAKIRLWEKIIAFYISDLINSEF